MVHAPTGMGKTAAVLHSALKATEAEDVKILFLTAKHTHQNIVYETMKRINASSGKSINFAGVNGKRSMCLLENSAEPAVFTEFCRAVREQDMCNFYKNTFTKSKEVKGAVIEALNEEISDPASVMAAGEKFFLCPYELSLLNAKRSKVVVANYSHAFDAEISKGFLSKAGIIPSDTVLIVDEAHNLPGRIMDMNSFSISSRTLERAYKEVSSSGSHSVAKKVDKIIGMLRVARNDDRISAGGIFSDGDLIEIDDIIEANEKGYNVPASVTLKRFIGLLNRVDERFVVYASKDGNSEKINIDSLDPEKYSKDVIKGYRSSILISGTFKPMDMFANLLGINNSERLALETEVPENRLMINETDLTSKFSSRGEQYSMIAERIDELLDGFESNSIFFFPSYNFMNNTFTYLNNREKVLKEEPNIGREKKQEIMRQLSRPGRSLFAVINGNFSESIGLKDNVIKMVCIVGVPFEPPSVRLKALQSYYEKKFGNGFEYAQVLPSMIKTMQAAGRGIRSEKDRAAIILMDTRYSSDVFKKYLPGGVISVNGSPMGIISEFGLS